ncbi:brachyurin-like [Spodoptera frugiperda]|uniref:Brachyurin-like n=1 Tax=Spodoptera frugiperda TaxID=7108 RepID=A0A2H1VEB7_SPOFR|nr:brachyurin-like [Spodoptera frugiperda]
MMKTSTLAGIGIGVVMFILLIIGIVEMSKFAEHQGSSSTNQCPHRLSQRHVISLSEHNLNRSVMMSLGERFPYVIAITRNATNLWTFACFASVILMQWIVTSAHCRVAGYIHRAILFNDFARNQTFAFPILYWRLHEKYNSSLAKYDIAVAKLNLHSYEPSMKPAVFDESMVTEVEASVWKTVATMDKKVYLTNHFDKYEVRIADPGKCYESYGVPVDDSTICIDTSAYEDCFVHEYGPIYSGDKVVGIIAVKPVDCEMKLAIFTNVSYFTNWILRTTYDG